MLSRIGVSSCKMGRFSARVDAICWCAAGAVIIYKKSIFLIYAYNATITAIL